MKKSYVNYTLSLAAVAALTAGCASSGVQNPRGVPVTEMKADERGFVAGTGVESQDLVAVTDWNRHPVVAGRGSAIFLHVWRKARHPTAGCIAFRRGDLAWILARWTRRDRVVVRGESGRS